MKSENISISLTPLQISHMVVALTEHSKKLLTDAEENPVGGEHEDYLIVQSVLKLIISAKEKTNPNA